LNVTIKIIKIGLYLPQIKVAHLMSRSVVCYMRSRRAIV